MCKKQAWAVKGCASAASPEERGCPPLLRGESRHLAVTGRERTLLLMGISHDDAYLTQSTLKANLVGSKT